MLFGSDRARSASKIVISIDPDSVPDPTSSDAIAALLTRHLSALRAFIVLRCGVALREQESVSDLVQSVCLDLLASPQRPRFDCEAEFRKWLFTSAERQVIDRARFWQAGRRNKKFELDDAEALAGYASLFTPSKDAAAREEIARIESAFAALPERYRDVITASRLLGLSYEEIAAQRGRSPGAIRTQLCRALARLSELLEADPRAPRGLQPGPDVP